MLKLSFSHFIDDTLQKLICIKYQNRINSEKSFLKDENGLESLGMIQNCNSSTGQLF